MFFYRVNFACELFRCRCWILLGNVRRCVAAFVYLLGVVRSSEDSVLNMGFGFGAVWVVVVSVFIFSEGRLALVGLRSFNEFGVVSELRCSIGWCSFGDVLKLRSCWCGFFAGSGLQFRRSTLLVCWWGDQQCWSRNLVVGGGSGVVRSESCGRMCFTRSCDLRSLESGMCASQPAQFEPTYIITR